MLATDCSSGPPQHTREALRLASVHDLDQSAGDHDPVLEALAGVAARQLDMPIAAISLVDESHQVFKASVGFDGASRPRDDSLCAWVVGEETLLEVNDLLDDPRFADSPVAAAGLRFYAGTPVYDTAGLPVGALCVLDGQPRRLTPQARRQLEELAETASAQFELLLLRAAGRTRGTALGQAQGQLARQLLTDPLTGLPNRELLTDRLVQAVADTARSTGHVGVCAIGLDQFERVNDSRGHATGDRLLAAVAARVAELIRPGDTLARLYGDQYVVVLRDLAEPVEAEPLAARLAGVFLRPFDIDGTPVSLTASIGVTTGRAPQGADELLSAAEAAMRDAKARGRARTRVYTSELRDGAADRLRTEVALRRGLERDEFTLHYQPVIDLAQGRVVGVEALVRWQHPTEGLLLPGAFIPVAEATGLIVPLGAWVLDQACRQAAAWDAAGRPLHMAVNLSARQVSHVDIVPTLRRALDSSGLPAERLLVEVTESAVMEDAEAAGIALAQIAQLGASVAIDDFGTGYSSLLYLKRYPIHALKVDRWFVSGLDEDGDDAAIVASLISLSRAVGAVCVAEGIETATQYQRLVALGCHYGQGYLFSRPVPAEDLLSAVDESEQRLAAAGSRRLPPRGDRRVTSPVSAAVAARIMGLHADGASLHTIAAALNHEGARHPEGIRWHAASVARHIATAPAKPAVGWAEGLGRASGQASSQASTAPNSSPSR
jgi:diguanylate cyclase (GGDEF)-like protein